jgi:hypothetical protein
MNWKGFGRKPPWLNKALFHHLPKETEEKYGRSQGFGVPAEIRTDYFKNTNLGRYC